MLNPVATEAIYSATYVDNYIDSVDNLPDDVQRHLSRIRDLDVHYRGLLREVDHYYDLWRTLYQTSDVQSGRRQRAINRMQQSLIQAQELGDEKMQMVNQLQELIDIKTRQLDTDQRNLNIKDGQMHQMDDCGSTTPQKQTRTQSPARSEQLNASIISGGILNITGIGNGGTLGIGIAGNINTGKEHNPYSSYASSFSAACVGAGGGSSTPNSERSCNIGSGSGIVLTTGGNGLHSAVLGGAELQRTGSKRSRRRNESMLHSGLMDSIGGNESNSANEAGSNGDRHSGKSGGISGNQKKNSTHHQGSGNNGGAGGSGGAGNNNSGGGNNSGKKKKRKVRGSGQSSSVQVNVREETPPPDPIDPDEPTYCVCNQISFGEMILCDNDLCPIEWFHFSCVSLVLKPKGKWYCPNCRGDRQNVMKPKAQFLKELERYNKEKEEKT